MAGPSIRDYVILVVAVVIDDAFERCPRVLNVVEITPQVAMLDN